MLWLLLLSPCFGSLVGVLAARLPAGRPVALDRSRCDTCGAVVPARDLVPFLSFVLLRGRCRRCRAPIGWRHPAAEAAGLAVAASAATVSGDLPWLLASCALGWTLLALAWIDAEHLWLPDVLTLPLLLAGLAATVVLDPESLTDHALAALLGFAAFRAVSLAYRRLRGHDGLGGGDAKLLAALGAWGGTAFLAPTVLVAAVLGLGLAGAMAARNGRAGLGTARFPFGTLLAAAFWGLWLWAAA